MNKPISYSGRCGACKWFDFRIKDGKICRWGGHCNNPKRASYHDPSQKCCKLYKPKCEYMAVKPNDNRFAEYTKGETE